MNKKGIAMPVLLLIAISAGATVTTGAAVGITNIPDVVPGSPFYGLKEYGRVVAGTFAVNKTAYQQEIIEQKQEELQVMQNLQLNNTSEYLNLQNEIQTRQQQIDIEVSVTKG